METTKNYTDEQILNTNPLVLAFIGDAVFTTIVRQKIVEKHNSNINALSKLTSTVVNAGNQYKLYRKIESLLTKFEIDICHRARNANIHSKAKNYSVTEYIYATAFEALIGYLHLAGKKERLSELMSVCLEDL